MIDEIFRVKLISTRDCFLHFSGPVLLKLSSKNEFSALKITYGNENKELYFTCAPKPDAVLDDNCLGISTLYGNHVGLSENEIVLLSTYNYIPAVRTICVSAASQDDYEIIEMSQNELQLSMLDQVRVVSVSQPITVWFSKTLHCTMIVDSLDISSKIGWLDQLTDVVISPSVVKAPSHSLQKNQQNSVVSDVDDSSNKLQFKDSISKLRLIEIMEKGKHPGVFRAIVIDDKLSSCCDSIHNSVKHPYNAFLNQEVLSFWANKSKEEHSAVVCFLTLVSNNFNKELFKSYSDSGIYVRVYPIQGNCQCIPAVNYGSNWKNQVLYVSDTVKNLIKLKNGSKVKLNFFTPCLDKKITCVSLSFTYNLSMNEVESWFREDLSKNANTLINNNAPMPIQSCAGELEHVVVSLTPSDILCWPFSSAELKTCKIDFSYSGDKESDKSDDNDSDIDRQLNEDDENIETTWKETSSNLFRNISQLSRSLGDVIKEGLVSLDLCLKLTSSPVLPHGVPIRINNNVLCVGSGAYILTDWLSNCMSRPPHNVFITKVDCKSLKGKKGENIQKKLSEQLQKCVYYQPSLLVLLDIDAIVGAPTEPENKVEEIFLQGSGRMIRDMLLENQLNQNIAVLATARSPRTVNEEVLGPRGYHFFPTLLQFTSFSKEDRIVIFKEIINKRLKVNNFNDVSLEEFAVKTDGYNYDDLLLLADKALFQSWQRKVKDRNNKELSVTLDDLSIALDSYTPTHLHSINLYKNTDHSFSSVGGMRMLKESLTEVVIWPSKFRKIYEQCPLSSESGVLLYGVPGTGKTLLASAVAGEAGLNFISIKGPELLSKYIGASEEAVRKVFEKAMKAKPCILFFDEFDSLAPRRGHDSSGVMDRVVNQLLTQMDGVEERTGVYIIAATSRPDLLDPALLRPGRIGHTLHCPLPDSNDRLEIMRVLSKRLILNSDCNLSFIANESDGFSGADLQALIYGAQMLAYDDMVNEDKLSVERDTNSSIHVRQDVSLKLEVRNSHLIAALRDTKPSLRLEEFRRYQKIYESFKKMRSKTNEGENLPVEISQKVTLA